MAYPSRALEELLRPAVARTSPHTEEAIAAKLAWGYTGDLCTTTGIDRVPKEDIVQAVYDALDEKHRGVSLGGLFFDLFTWGGEPIPRHETSQSLHLSDRQVRAILKLLTRRQLCQMHRYLQAYPSNFNRSPEGLEAARRTMESKEYSALFTDEDPEIDSSSTDK